MAEVFPIRIRTLTGLEEVLKSEVEALGGKSIEIGNRVVSCQGDLRFLYRANLWCRTAIRVLRPIAAFPAPDEKSLYQGVNAIDWTPWLDADETLAVDAHVHSSFTTHSLFLAQLTKDAVVDQFQAKGKRPSVDLERPDLRIAVSLFRNQAEVLVDSSGESLHRRGYRLKAVEAPLNEALAAGIVKLSGWNGETPIVDPMTGSGTLLIEAGMMLRNMASGLFRKRFGFASWKDFNASLFEEVKEEARAQQTKDKVAMLLGLEKSEEAVAIARENIERAGLSDLIRVEQADFFDFDEIPETPGVVVANPPYDERLAVDNIAELYQRIGIRLRERYRGWSAHILTGNLDAVKYIGLRSSRRTVLFNGAIEGRLMSYEIREDGPEKIEPRPLPTENPKWKVKAETFGNRLTKNFKHLSKWAKREGITCFRLYDWDIPELAFIVDIYGDRLHFAEIERNYDHSPLDHKHYISLMMDTAANATGIPRERLYFKKRKPQQKGGFQYGPEGETGEFLEMEEGGHRFLVNLADYLDVGLFLDHRQTRKMVELESSGKDFLNLFAYTGSFTVYAAAGGAKSTTTVDTSRTYLDWAEKNLRLNGFSGDNHKFIRSDVGEFLTRDKKLYDLAVVDPPTRSINRSSGRVFEVQEHHPELLRLVLDRVRPGGRVVFSTNYRNFTLDETALRLGRELHIEEITSRTVPPDFQRKPSHRCWLIQR